MSIEQILNLCKVKVSQLPSMSKVIACINQRFAVKNSGKSCHPENDNHAHKNRFKVARNDKSFTNFFVDQCEFMAYQALWIWQVAGSLATWIQVQQGAEA